MYNNRDIRVLKDENGEDALVYTFLNSTTILITTRREAIDAVARAAFF